MKAPVWLGKIGRAKWKEILASNPHITERDADTLALHCRSWELQISANEVIDRDGINVSGPNGMMRQNPAIQVYNEAHKQLLRTTKLLCLRPDGVTAPEDLDF